MVLLELKLFPMWPYDFSKLRLAGFRGEQEVEGFGMMTVYTMMEYIDRVICKVTSGKIKYKINYCKVTDGDCDVPMV